MPLSVTVGFEKKNGHRKWHNSPCGLVVVVDCVVAVVTTGETRPTLVRVHSPAAWQLKLRRNHQKPVSFYSFWKDVCCTAGGHSHCRAARLPGQRHREIVWFLFPDWKLHVSILLKCLQKTWQCRSTRGININTDFKKKKKVKQSSSSAGAAWTMLHTWDQWDVEIS